LDKRFIVGFLADARVIRYQQTWTQSPHGGPKKPMTQLQSEVFHL
jgi:hypothetical protein